MRALSKKRWRCRARLAVEREGRDLPEGPTVGAEVSVCGEVCRGGEGKDPPGVS